MAETLRFLWEAIARQPRHSRRDAWLSAWGLLTDDNMEAKCIYSSPTVVLLWTTACGLLLQIGRIMHIRRSNRHRPILIILRSTVAWRCICCTASWCLSERRHKHHQFKKKKLKAHFNRHSVLTNSRCFSFSSISVTYNFSCFYCNALLDFIL